MKKYLTPSIEVISFNQVDILTASESIDFKYAILTNLSTPEHPPGNPLVPRPTPNGLNSLSPHFIGSG